MSHGLCDVNFTVRSENRCVLREAILYAARRSAGRHNTTNHDDGTTHTTTAANEERGDGGSGRGGSRGGTTGAGVTMARGAGGSTAGGGATGVTCGVGIARGRRPTPEEIAVANDEVATALLQAQQRQRRQHHQPNSTMMGNTSHAMNNVSNNTMINTTSRSNNPLVLPTVDMPAKTKTSGAGGGGRHNYSSINSRSSVCGFGGPPSPLLSERDAAEVRRAAAATFLAAHTQHTNPVPVPSPHRGGSQRDLPHGSQKPPLHPSPPRKRQAPITTITAKHCNNNNHTRSNDEKHRPLSSSSVAASAAPSLTSSALRLLGGRRGDAGGGRGGGGSACPSASLASHPYSHHAVSSIAARREQEEEGCGPEGFRDGAYWAAGARHNNHPDDYFNHAYRNDKRGGYTEHLYRQQHPLHREGTARDAFRCQDASDIALQMPASQRDTTTTAGVGVRGLRQPSRPASSLSTGAMTTTPTSSVVAAQCRAAAAHAERIELLERRLAMEEGERTRVTQELAAIKATLGAIQGQARGT